MNMSEIGLLVNRPLSDFTTAAGDDLSGLFQSRALVPTADYNYVAGDDQIGAVVVEPAVGAKKPKVRVSKATTDALSALQHRVDALESIIRQFGGTVDSKLVAFANDTRTALQMLQKQVADLTAKTATIQPAAPFTADSLAQSQGYGTWVLSAQSGLVTHGGGRSAAIKLKPNGDFQGQRIICSPSIPGAFTLEVLANNVPITALQESTTSINADAASPANGGIPLSLPIVNQGNVIQVTFVNNHAATDGTCGVDFVGVSAPANLRNAQGGFMAPPR